MTKRGSAEPLHREKGQVAVAIQFMHSHDVRVGKILQALEFVAKFSHELRPRDDLGVQYLDGHLLAAIAMIESELINRCVHRSHTALRQDSQNAVAVAQDFTDHKRTWSRWGRGRSRYRC